MRPEWKEVPCVIKVKAMLIPSDKSRCFGYVDESEHCVLGLIQVGLYDDTGRSQLDPAEAGWASGLHVVDNVYFAGAARKLPRTDGTESVAVRAGKAALTQELFTHHSRNRNREGDKWAKAVGGQFFNCTPEPDQSTNTESNLSQMLETIAEQNSWSVIETPAR
jgi:hypothetical protein